MIENPSNLTQQLLNLVERVAVEIRAIYNKLQTAVFKVNGQIPDSKGNIQIDAVTKATQDGNGNVISNTYVKKTDKVTSASSADSAIKATQDASGNVITSTYATKSELNAIDVGVSSFNGQTGSVTYTAPVTSVNGKTGAVVVDVGVTSVNGQTGAVTGLATLASPTFTGAPKAPTASAGTNTTQLATTAFVTTAVANKTSVSGNAGTATKLATPRTITLTGDATGSVSFDGSKNVSLDVTVSGGGGDTSTLIPKSGDRGLLAGYNTGGEFVVADGDTITIDKNSPDDMIVSKSSGRKFTLNFASADGAIYVKNILLYCDQTSEATVVFGENVISENYFKTFVNEIDLGLYSRVVVTSYGGLVLVSCNNLTSTL